MSTVPPPTATLTEPASPPDIATATPAAPLTTHPPSSCASPLRAIPASSDGALTPPPALASRLTLGLLIGRGSFGRVYRGVLGGTTPVAVKIVPDRLGAALAEARVGHALSHPNVVRTLEYAVSAGGEEPVAWIVQEFCGAGTLYDAVDRGWLRDGFDFFSAPDLAALLHTLREVAAGLAHLHAAGVTHGDLTGANVLLVPRGPGFDQEEDGVRESGPGGGGGDLHHPEDSTPTHPTHEGLDTPQQTLAPDPRAFRAKLADFGMSLPLGRGAVLQEVTTYGTVSHMPPELLEAGRLSHAADVYALGVLLYEMHEGQRAWRGLRAPQVLHRVLALGQELRPAPPRPGNPVHAALVALMSRCLSRDPGTRPSAAEAAREAERALAMLAAAPRCAKLGAGDAGARPCVVGALAALAPPADPAVLAGGWVTPRIMPPEAIADFLVRQEAA